MTSSTPWAILGAVAAVLTAAAVVGFGSAPAVLGLISASVAAALASVAFSTQSRRLRDEQRLVYRPVYVRRQVVQQRVRSDD